MNYKKNFSFIYTLLTLLLLVFISSHITYGEESEKNSDKTTKEKSEEATTLKPLNVNDVIGTWRTPCVKDEGRKVSKIFTKMFAQDPKDPNKTSFVYKGYVYSDDECKDEILFAEGYGNYTFKEATVKSAFIHNENLLIKIRTNREPAIAQLRKDCPGREDILIDKEITIALKLDDKCKKNFLLKDIEVDKITLDETGTVLTYTTKSGEGLVLKVDPIKTEAN